LAFRQLNEATKSEFLFSREEVDLADTAARRFGAFEVTPTLTHPFKIFTTHHKIFYGNCTANKKNMIDKKILILYCWFAICTLAKQK